MFTGIIHQVGEIIRVEPREQARLLTVLADKLADSCKLGDSIAVNGCCLTIERIAGIKLSFTAGAETTQNTTLGSLNTGAKVNLEPALTLNDRLGGHIVLGHVDGVASVVGIDTTKTGAFEYLFKLPGAFYKYLTPKGSIAIDGVSLTVHQYSVEPTIVACYIIPHSFRHTVIQSYKTGQQVNFEIDNFAKMMWHMVSQQKFDLGLK